MPAIIIPLPASQAAVVKSDMKLVIVKPPFPIVGHTNPAVAASPKPSPKRTAAPVKKILAGKQSTLNSETSLPHTAAGDAIEFERTINGRQGSGQCMLLEKMLAIANAAKDPMLKREETRELFTFVFSYCGRGASRKDVLRFLDHLATLARTHSLRVTVLTKAGINAVIAIGLHDAEPGYDVCTMQSLAKETKEEGAFKSLGIEDAAFLRCKAARRVKILVEISKVSCPNA
eukprot:Opistho-2@21857